MATNDILNKIGAYKSLCESADPLSGIKNRFALTNNNTANITPFLIDIIVVLAGKNSLEGILQTILNDFIPEFENTAKSLLTKAMTNTRMGGLKLSQINFLNNGTLKLPSKSLDFFDKLKDENRPLTNLQEAIKNASITGQKIEVDSSLSVIKDPVTNEYAFTFENIDFDKKLSEFYAELVQAFFSLNIDSIIDDLISEIFNNRVEQNKFEKNKLLENIINQEDPITSEFTRFDFQAIAQQKTQSVKSGFVTNGCNPEFVSITEKDVELIISSGTEAFAGQMSDFILDKTSEDQDSSDNAMKTLIERLLFVLTEKITLSTEAVFLLGISRVIESNNNYGSELMDFSSYIKTLLPNIKCLIVGLRDDIFNFIVDIIEDLLGDIISCLASEYAKERSEAYSRVLTTLLPI